MPRKPRTLPALLSMLLPTLAGAAPTVAPTPFVPAYGQVVSLQIANLEWPTYIPVSRFTRSGSHFTVEFETLGNNFDSGRSDFGYKPVPLGELPAGNYTVSARVYDISRPELPAQEVRSQFAVVPPSQWGVYSVPQNPRAYEAASAMIRSAAYFDPATMKATASGNVLRVDFDYDPDKPVGPAAPAGMTSFASVPVGRLAPGTYKLEGWGRPIGGGVPQKFFERELRVDSAAVVHEFYHPTLDHYFMAAGPDEIERLDAGGHGGWQRTGHSFHAWLRAEDAPAAARPVCRFYAAGPNSHFYTGDAAECQGLKDLEAKGRAAAAATNTRFGGWAYEGIAFHALVPSGGACPAETEPVYRAYNDRARQNDSNHRFMRDGQMRAAMRWTWVDEGAAFCSPR